MARPLRIEFPGAIYHLTARGNARQNIFLDDEDRQRFLSVLERIVSRFHVALHAYCLMDNHYHLLLETPDGNLSQAMRQLNGVYTQGFNRRYGKVGHVLQGRFKAILVDRDGYLLELCRYVVLNPVRAKITRKPGTYRWSSYRATAGRAPVPPFLNVDWLLAQFGKQRAAAGRKYEIFVAEGMGQASPWERLQGQVLLGGEAFVERLRPGLQDKRPIKEIPRKQRFAARPALATLFASRALPDLDRRNEAIRHAHLEHGYSLSAIGQVLGLHYSTISRIVNRDAGIAHAQGKLLRD
jgi:REP-associated tyrosine transposase